MVRFLISIAFWGVAFIRGRHLLDNAAYFDLSVKKCGNYLEASSHSQMFFKIGVFKVGLPHQKKIVLFACDWKPFQNDEKCILFRPKSSFHSEGI